MARLRVYVDTSVFGGADDEEFAAPSRRFFEFVNKGLFTILVSPHTEAELEGAPEDVRAMLAGLPPEYVETVRLGAEVEALADAYIDAGAVGQKWRGDALHVAAAAVAGADLVLSWNFRHIVHYDRIRKFNEVNLAKGLGVLDIRSPMEVVYGDED